MNKAYLGATLLASVSCTSVGASAINPSDDLHCAVAIQTLAKNADQLGANPAARKGLYVLQTWYFSKIERERLGEVRNAVEVMKNNAAQLSSASQICSNRAFSDHGFSGWKAIASDDYDEKTTR
jgi:hypothetical protein